MEATLRKQVLHHINLTLSDKEVGLLKQFIKACKDSKASICSASEDPLFGFTDDFLDSLKTSISNDDEI